MISHSCNSHIWSVNNNSVIKLPCHPSGGHPYRGQHKFSAFKQSFSYLSLATMQWFADPPSRTCNRQHPEHQHHRWRALHVSPLAASRTCHLAAAPCLLSSTPRAHWVWSARSAARPCVLPPPPRFSASVWKARAGLERGMVQRGKKNEWIKNKKWRNILFLRYWMPFMKFMHDSGCICLRSSARAGMPKSKSDRGINPQEKNQLES